MMLGAYRNPFVETSGWHLMGVVAILLAVALVLAREHTLEVLRELCHGLGVFFGFAVGGLLIAQLWLLCQISMVCCWVLPWFGRGIDDVLKLGLKLTTNAVKEMEEEEDNA